MPVRNLRKSRVLAIERFASFEEFRPTDIIGGGTSTPLRPRDFSLTRATLALPASRLVVQRSFARRLEADLGAPGAALIIPMSSDTFAEINGRQITASTVALIRGEVPARAFEPHDANIYALLRFQSEMQNRGWVDLQEGFELFSIGSDKMRRVQFVLNGIFVHASGCTDARQFAESGEAMEEKLLSALDDVLVSPEATKPSPGSFERHRKLVMRIDDLAHEEPATPLSTKELARSLGASVRTLHTAVQAVHGMGLHRYVRLKRLWLVRHQLSRGLPGQSVRAAALAYGFWHMGEFAQLYKATFGESPSETLRRGQV
jgi:AraC family ethanolamine operon transcriptional activator